MSKFWKKSIFPFLICFTISSSLFTLQDDDLPPHHGTLSEPYRHNTYLN